MRGWTGAAEFQSTTKFDQAREPRRLGLAFTCWCHLNNQPTLTYEMAGSAIYHAITTLLKRQKHKVGCACHQGSTTILSPLFLEGEAGRGAALTLLTTPHRLTVRHSCAFPIQSKAR